MAANRSIVQLKLLWFTVGILVISSAILAGLIITNSKLTWDPSYEGINNFVEIFKVPLSIVALIIPAVAIIASNHRSIQTAAQIKISIQQNIFTNYFKHKEEFVKYLSEYDDLFKGLKEPVCNDPSFLHKLFFPNVMDGDYSVDKEILITIEEDISDYLALCKSLCKVDEDYLFNINEINDEIENTSKYYEISSELLSYHMIGSTQKLDVSELGLGVNSIFIPYNITQLLYQYVILVFALDYIMKFDKDYVGSKVINSLKSAKFECEGEQCTIDHFSPINTITAIEK
ncbi:hypothetical protein L4D76_24890 [Photobacterium sagamiensis]|uniref:hypothetical protein n=1 Tax=Photobacterium sagamiensis TaxID=2910241 RepID=UPI003D10DA20